MAAALKFLAGKNGGANFVELNGSGLGFYGASFGTSVQVGQYNRTTFIASPDGATQGPEANNTQKLASTSGLKLNDTTDTELPYLLNDQATLNIRFTFDTPVKTQNAELRVFDRVNQNSDPSGLTCQVAQIIKGWAGAPVGSGSAAWVQAHGSGVTLPLVASPGTSGHSPDGIDTTDVRHDWYLAVSPSPNSIGSKTQFGLFVSLEYL